MNKFWRAFMYIRNRDRIPKLPRRMLARDYEKIDRPEGRVLARLGARDPTGVKVAMKRAGVNTLEELVATLEHQQPRRNAMRRLRVALGRVFGGYETDPHRAAILKDARKSRQSSTQQAVQQRIDATRRALKERE